MTHSANRRYYGTEEGIRACIYDINMVLSEHVAFGVVNAMFPEPKDDPITEQIVDSASALLLRMWNADIPIPTQRESLVKRTTSWIGTAALDLADKAVRVATPR